ncbi:MAG: mechanosensitive ion channel family protein [Pseudomonadota bacterium]
METNPIELVMETTNSMVAGFFERLPQLGIAVFVLALTFIAARLLRAAVTAVMKGAKVRAALIRLSTNLIGIASWILGFAIAITIIFPSITPASLIAGLGLTSVAIGFAFKDIFENFLAGIIILAREKMRIGDIIECEDVFGRIEDIEIRETHVRETDGELVIVPNAYLFKNPLKIQTDRDHVRQDLTVGVDYDCSLPEAREALQRAIESCESVTKDKPVEVRCVAFGGSSIDFKLLWWTDSEPRDQRGSYDEVAFAVKKELDEAGIGIPFPQTTLSFRPEAQPVQIAQKTVRQTEDA